MADLEAMICSQTPFDCLKITCTAFVVAGFLNSIFILRKLGVSQSLGDAVVVMDANEDSGDQKQNYTLNCLLCASKAVNMVYTSSYFHFPNSKMTGSYFTFYLALQLSREESSSEYADVSVCKLYRVEL